MQEGQQLKSFDHETPGNELLAWEAAVQEGKMVVDTIKSYLEKSEAENDLGMTWSLFSSCSPHTFVYFTPPRPQTQLETQLTPIKCCFKSKNVFPTWMFEVNTLYP